MSDVNSSMMLYLCLCFKVPVVNNATNCSRLHWATLNPVPGCNATLYPNRGVCWEQLSTWQHCALSGSGTDVYVDASDMYSWNERNHNITLFIFIIGEFVLI